MWQYKNQSIESIPIYQIHVNVSSMLNDYLISPHYFLTYAFNIFVVIMLHVSHKL